ncbi:MAG TPA: sterol desaturase family protein [Actinocrinis sp.]|nr:sterol desaturase family protein [Actinocrinis sp.]
MDLTRPTRPLLTYGTYPSLLLLNGVGLWAGLTGRADRNAVIAGTTLLTVIVLFLVERINPLLDRWAMTGESLLRRDLPFIGLAVLAEQAATTAVAALAAATVPAGGFGPVGRLPSAGQAVLALIGLDLLWYGYHRAAHTVDRLWRIHGAHHSPAQVYVLVHLVFHPIDLIVSRFVISMIVFRLTGMGPDAAFVAIVLLGLQQTVSHINSDLRLGWANYLVVGPETHRFHHAVGERGNYSEAISLWDLVFRTFHYHPDRVPEQLGLIDPAGYPDPRRFRATLVWPFRATTPSAL